MTYHFGFFLSLHSFEGFFLLRTLVGVMIRICTMEVAKKASVVHPKVHDRGPFLDLDLCLICPPVRVLAIVVGLGTRRLSWWWSYVWVGG